MEEMRDFLYDLAEYIDESIDSEDPSAESLSHYLQFVEDELSSMVDVLDENCEHRRLHRRFTTTE